jgi:hypothetical protein
MFLSKSLTWAALAVALAGGASAPAFAQARRGHDRPLTISRHAGAAHRGTGIEYRDGGREVVAWGGFSANGYGPRAMGSEAARREARNESVRLRTDGVYGYGFDGLGGTFDDGELNNSPGFGYNNPNYGNAFNGYTGYGGVPTALAFGPAFANRHITDSDDDDVDVPGPTPGELGYAASPASFGLGADD